MTHREVGSEHHELFAVREIDGAPRVYCPARAHEVLFSECQSCEAGTPVRVRGSAFPLMLCPTSGAAREAEVEVRAIMRPVVTVPWDTDEDSLVRRFTTEGLTAAVVVDDDGSAAGLVTRNHLLHDHDGWTSLHDALLEPRTAEDLMVHEMAYVTPDAPISSAAKVMARAGIKHLPVLDLANRPVGMVSAIEIAQWAAELAG